MSYEVRDPFARFIGLEVVGQTEDGLETRSAVSTDVCNIYLSAHGGYVYALGHCTAALAAQICLGRQTVVVDVSSQYLCALRPPEARVKAHLVRAGREMMVYRTEIRDSGDNLCCTQTVTLKAVDYPEAPVLEARPIIVSATEDTPPDPVTGVIFPRISTHFGGLCHVFNLGPSEDGMRYAMDLYPETCNLYGGAHGGALYTMCDVAACGTAAFLLEKRPVTVSSSIHFLRSGRVGPVYAQTHLMRNGKQMVFYRVDLTDGDGGPVAMANFVLQSVEFAAKRPADNGLGYQSKVFKEN